MPKEFNWVKARSECSPSQLFNELRLGVEDDIAEINKLPGKDAHIAQNCNGKTFKVWRGESPEPSVKFCLNTDRIEIFDGNGTLTRSYSVSFSSEGRCVLVGSDGEAEQWQARREALEGLFFHS